MGALEQLRAWLKENGCRQVAMESTGTYWQPVFNVLEEDLKVILANAQQVKNLPGKKSDRKDGRHLAKWLRHGLIKTSFIPPQEIRDLRTLTRRRRKLVETGASERNRVQKVLEGAKCETGNVLSDRFGKSGQDMLEALIETRRARQKSRIWRGGGRGAR